MTYCTNCGDELQAEAFYCGNCGHQKTQRNGETGRPPQQTPSREGFLSGRALEYVHEVINDEREIDQDSPAHNHLLQDTALAFRHFVLLNQLDEFSLWEPVFYVVENDGIRKSSTRMTPDKQYITTMVGFLGMVEMLGECFDADWHDEALEYIDGLVEEIGDIEG